MAAVVKKPRTSMGVSAEARNANVTAQFDDFRRRHIKQNKEIIQSNVEQKLASKILREEILGLKAEILRIQQQNAKLQHRILVERRNERGTLGASESDKARTALETILSTIPALQSLHAALGQDSQSDHRGSRTGNNELYSQSRSAGGKAPERGVYTCKMPDVACVRPAEEYRQGALLAVVDEDEVDDGVVYVEEEQERMIGRGDEESWIDEERWDSRTSPMGSRATRTRLPIIPRTTSPIRPNPATPSSTPTRTPAPMPHSSPSPRARASPTRRTKDRRRGRRESGLLEPLSRAELVVSPVQQIGEGEDGGGGGVMILPNGVEAAPAGRENILRRVEVGGDGKSSQEEEEADEEDEDAVLGMISARTPEPVEVPQLAGNSQATSAAGLARHPGSIAVKAPQPTSLADEAPGPSPAAKTSQSHPQAVVPHLSSETAVEVEEITGRAGRRARSSVSYKEPSLNKKMRKPDGSSSTGRPSLMLPSDLTGVDSHGIDTDPSSSQSAGSASAKSRSSKSVKTASAAGGSLRRKSTLPKASKKGIASKAQRHGDEGEDEGESDEDGDLPVHLYDGDTRATDTLTGEEERHALVYPPRKETEHEAAAAKCGLLLDNDTIDGSSASSSISSSSSSSVSQSSISSASSTLTALSISSRSTMAPGAQATSAPRSGLHPVPAGPTRASPRKGTGVHARLAAPAVSRTERAGMAAGTSTGTSATGRRLAAAVAATDGPPVSSRRTNAGGRSTPIPFA